MRIALGLLAALVAGVVVFAVTIEILTGDDPGSWFGEFLDALPEGVTAGTLTFAAITTWVIVAARRRKRRQDEAGDRPREP